MRTAAERERDRAAAERGHFWVALACTAIVYGALLTDCYAAAGYAAMVAAYNATKSIVAWSKRP